MGGVGEANMEEILNALLTRIKNKVEDLSLVDEDTGQLDALDNETEDGYPVTFPCVLIGNTDINWSDVTATGSVQKADGMIIVRLAIDCYDDTHIGSGTTDKITERQQLATSVYKALQGYRTNTKYMGPLKRTRSRDYTLPGNIKVYEQMYRLIYHDESAK